MLRTVIMAAVSKVNPVAVEGPTAALGRRAQIRAFQAQSSPVYKTQVDELTNGMKGIKGNMGGSQVRRGIFGSNGNKPKVTSLQDVANFIKDDTYKNIVVVAGAGISTPSGIPDFRTPGTGLYDNLQQYQVPYPEAIFDIEYFNRNPKPFYVLAKELYPSGKYRPNIIHYFCRYLQDRGVLLRMYTQNIDGLERLAGIPPEKLVEAHGTFSSAACTLCRQKHEGEEIKESIFADRLPKCKRRGCPGIVKPDITFFGEDLPQRFYFYLKDMLQTDLVIVMGTSLEVQPFAGIIDSVKWDVPRILFNMFPVGPFKFHRRAQDFVSPGDLINSIQKFTSMVGWKSELTELITKEEGSYVICSPDYAKKAAEAKNKPPPRPAPNSIWRQRANLNLYDSDSSDSSESESESDSSSDDDKHTRRHVSRRNYSRSAPRSGQNVNNIRKPGTLGRGWVNGSTGVNNGGGGGSAGNGGKSRNYSSEASLTSRSDKTSLSTINKSGVAKLTRDVNGVTNKLSKLKLRSKSGTPDGISKEKPIQRTLSGKNLKNSENGEKVKLKRSSSVGAMKDGKNKDASIKHSSSDSKLSKELEEKSVSSQNQKNLRNVQHSVSEGNVQKEDKSTQETLSRRMKPPIPRARNNSGKKTPLNALNTRPYGYSQKRLPHRPSVPANLVDNARVQYVNKALTNNRSNSADLPKISYRHKLQPSYDARIFAIRVPDSDSESSLTIESSSDECG